MTARIPEQLATAQKAGVESLHLFFNTGFDAYEKLVALNLQAAKASILENEAVALEALALSVKDPQSVFGLQSRQSQATAKKVQAYWHHVKEIAIETQRRLLSSSEKLTGEYVRGAQVIIDSLTQMPPASNQLVTAFWSKGFGAMWDTGGTLREQASAAARQVAEVIDKAGKPAANA